MRIACVADTHGALLEIPPCDVLLLGGDLCPVADHGVERQLAWLDVEFRAWLDAVPAEHVVGIAGNHDFAFERAAARIPPDLRWTLLEDAAVSVAGLTIFGSPWTPWFHDWAFNAPREDGEAFLADRWASAPAATDVLLIHGPPAGYGDRTDSGHGAGSVAFADLIARVRPQLAVFGHIHEGRGAWRRGPTRLLNVAAVDSLYAPYPDPVVLVEL